MPSSMEQSTEEGHGCVAGILVDIEQEKVEEREVCLADENGEELDLIVWEGDIKEEKGTQNFRIVTGVLPERRDWAVQTEWSAGQEGFVTLLKEFPNLQVGGGLLPDHRDLHVRGEDLELLEWTVVDVV